MEERVSQLEQTMSVLHAEVSELKELLVSGFKKVENNFELIKNQVASLTISVDALKGSTSEAIEDVGGKIETLTEEIVKIGKVTRYDDYFKNLENLKN